MKGHNGLDDGAWKDRIGGESFIKGLRQDIKETLWEKCPNSFQEAIQSAQQREVFLNSVGKRSGVNDVSEDLIGLIQKFNTDRERSNQEIWKAIQSLTTPVQELATARRNENPWNPPTVAERRPPGAPGVCYRCNQPGHMRRSCPLNQRQPMRMNQESDRRPPAAREPISEQTTPRSCCQKNGGIEEEQQVSPESKVVDLNCSLMSRLPKEGIWVRGKTNNVDVDIFVDTGAKYSLIDYDFWNKICMGRKFCDTLISVVGAGGKNLAVISEGNVSLRIGGIYFDLLVVIVDDFKFDLLLGDELLREVNFVIDYHG